VTYVDEPESFETHLENLKVLRRLDPGRILPNHGDPDVIGAGGYPPGLITATERYIQALRRAADDPAVREAPLRKLVGDSIEAGWINYFEPYEAVHRENLATVLGESAS